MKNLKYNILNKPKKSMLKKLCVFALIQVMLLGQLAWAGTDTVGLANKLNQDTLSPQIIFNAQVFQQACDIYSFWIERVPGAEYPQVDYSSAQAVLTALQALPEGYRNIKHLDQSYAQGGNPELLRGFYKFSKELEEKYGFGLIMVSAAESASHREYSTAEAVYKALVQRESLARTYKSLGCSKENNGDYILLNAYLKHKDAIAQRYGWVMMFDYSPSNRFKYETLEETYQALMQLSPDRLNATALQMPKKQGGNVTLYNAYLKFRKQLKNEYGFEMPDTRGAVYPDYDSTYRALMLRPENMRNKTSLIQSKENKGDPTLLKACYKYGVKLEQTNNTSTPPLKKKKYPDARIAYKALMARPVEIRTVAALRKSKVENGNIPLLRAYYEFKDELEKTYSFVMPKAPVKGRMYPDAKTAYQGFMARDPGQRTRRSLQQLREQGGDAALEKAYDKFRQELKEKFNFEMESGFIAPIRKHPKKMKYPDAQTTYNALMKRPEEIRTLKALKLPKLEKGDVSLLTAYYKFQDELKEKFKFVLYGSDRMKYRTHKDTYEALMALDESQRTAKSLDQAVKDKGNRVLLKAARKFRDELLKIYGFVLPQEQLDTRRFKTAKEVYDALLARDKNLRTVQSLKASSENKGDWTLLKAYYLFKDEIEKEFGFVLYEGPDAKYPNKQAVEDALLNLAPEDRTSKRLKELRLFNLLNRCYEYGVSLEYEPRIKVYNSRQEVIDALEIIPLRDRTAVRLQRKKEENGNALLYVKAVEFRVRLPLESVMLAYPTKESALTALENFSDEQRLPSKLARALRNGGDPMLLLACLEYDIKLPKDKVKYSTKRLVRFMLSRYPLNMRTQHMLRLSVEQGGIGDDLLYQRCLEFNIPLEKEPSKFTYPTVEATYNALRAVSKVKRTYTQLKKEKIEGGNPTLYKAFKRFREELKQKYNFSLESEPLGKYKTYEAALEALNARTPEDRIARKLLASKNERGDPGLYYACKRFDILLPQGKRERNYDTPEAAQAALNKRPLEKRTATELNKPVDEDGDPSLYKACNDFNIPLPRMVVDKEYPNAKVTFEALMEIAKEDRQVSKLSRPKLEDGNPNLLKAYYEFRSELKRVYKFIMPGTYKTPYPTKESAEQALEKRSKEQCTVLALSQPYPQGNRALLNAARKYEIELPKGYMEKFYPDAESAYKALKQRKEKHNTAKMLDRPIGQGGNRTLLIAYHQFREEIKEKFDYALPQEDRVGMSVKYPTKESAVAALNARSAGERTAKSLLKKKILGGDWALHSACKRFDIPLEQEEFLAGGYSGYRKKLLTAYEGKKIDIVEYWQAMQQVEGLGHERDMIFNAVLEYFMPIIFAKAENGPNATKVDSSKAFSPNQAFNNDDLVNSAILALIQALDSWHPDMTKQEDADACDDLEEYLLIKINNAIKQTKKKIYPDKWKEISRDAPYGNKDGNNYNAKSGPFGGDNQRIMDNTLESPVEPIDDALVRFEKMAEVIKWFAEGDYSFIQSAINTLDSVDSAQLKFDENLLISKKEKASFKKDLRDYLDKRNILKHIPGKYTVWIMGSLGNIGLARRGLSDVNILIVSDAKPYDLKDAMVEIRRAIGSGIVSMGKDNNITLEIGKEHDYHNMIYDSPDLVSLVDRYQLGNAENGIASIEMVSLQDSELKDSQALHRAQFHLTENLYQMGANASLIAESEPGIAEKTKEDFKQRINMGNHEYLFFMHDYLTGFFEKQVSKVIAAHQFAQPLNNQKPLNARNNRQNIDKAYIMEEYSDLKPDTPKSLEPEIIWLSDSQVKLDGTIVNISRVNGYLSFYLGGVLKKGVYFYQDFWSQILSDFNGKEIYVDDPKIDGSEKDVALLVAIEQQTEQLCAVLEQEVNALYAKNEEVSRRIDHIDDFNSIEVLEFDQGQRQIAMSTLTADKTLIKKDISLQSELGLVEQSI